jgi:hypothetical protein
MVVKELNTQLAVIPGGFTSQLQSLDISINKLFDAIYSSYLESIIKYVIQKNV